MKSNLSKKNLRDFNNLPSRLPVNARVIEEVECVIHLEVGRWVGLALCIPFPAALDYKMQPFCFLVLDNVFLVIPNRGIPCTGLTCDNIN